MSVFCPRCGQPTMRPIEAMNALSRRDNKTHICSPCGSAEATLDFFRIQHGSSDVLPTVREELDSWWRPLECATP
jgi:hypothetical protein